MDRANHFPTDPTEYEVLALLIDLEPMNCRYCGKETTRAELSICVGCGEGFCDRCAATCVVPCECFLEE